MILGLTIVLILVLLLPFSMKVVEKNLEFFLFAMGICAALFAGVLTGPLFAQIVQAPIFITLAVFTAGLLFRWLQSPIEKLILQMSQVIPFRLFLALTVLFLGLASSIITAIIAAIVLVTVTSVLRMDRKSEVRFVILACFSIGMGAALTPIGEPLSTIATQKLGAHFFFLLQLIGPDVIAALIVFSGLTFLLISPQKKSFHTNKTLPKEAYSTILIRSIKIYIFVMALTLLGAGFEPFIEQYLLGLSPLLLYWMNMISAVLDNATLAAAEISPAMDFPTIKAILLGLLISGGMLIPGNIPNIIAAGKLNITSLEWARFGVPLGLLAMTSYFFITLIFHLSAG